MAKKEIAEPCPKWMRHKWVDLPLKNLEEELEGRKQECQFCKGTRLKPVGTTEAIGSDSPDNDE